MEQAQVKPIPRRRTVRPPLPSPPRAALLLAGLALGLGATGCLNGDLVEPDFEILEEQKVAVVPFKDPLTPAVASRFAVDLSRAIANDIDRNNDNDIEVMSPREVESFFNKRDINDMTPQEIGLALGIDFLIFGEILQLDTEGATIGMSRGHLMVRVRVQDVVNDDMPYEDDVYVQYPTEEVMGFDRPQIERGLVRKAAAAVGRKFYAHEPPKREKLELPR